MLEINDGAYLGLSPLEQAWLLPKECTSHPERLPLIDTSHSTCKCLSGPIQCPSQYSSPYPSCQEVHEGTHTGEVGGPGSQAFDVSKSSQVIQ